jgi:hypothetical protein
MLLRALVLPIKDVTNDEVVILQELLQGKLDLPDIGITGGKTVQRLAQLRLKALNEQNKLADIEAQVPTAGLEEVLAGTLRHDAPGSNKLP